MTIGTASGKPHVTEVASRALPMSNRDKLACMLAGVYWVLYENVVFFSPAELIGAWLYYVTLTAKLLVPFAMLALVGMPRGRDWRSIMYLVAFAAFLAWGAVPTLISGEPLGWAKLLPRMVFFVAALSLFERSRAAFRVVAVVIIAHVLVALVQYSLVYATDAYLDVQPSLVAVMAGPFGLFGNVTGMMDLPGIPFPVVRLCGFWNEPSNASASAFAGFFLARYLAAETGRRRWRFAAVLSLLSGLLAFSNAGYLALGAALAFGILLDFFSSDRNKSLRAAALLPMAGLLFAVALYGRTFVVRFIPDDPIARAITGVRDLETQTHTPAGERFDLLNDAVERGGGSFVGVGIRTLGSEGVDASASAPLQWLLLVGVPGLALLLSRELVLWLAAWRAGRLHGHGVFVVQALAVIVTQHLAYGSWMNPAYMIMAAMTLIVARGGSSDAAAIAAPKSPAEATIS